MGLLRANREMQLLVSDNGGGLFRAAAAGGFAGTPCWAPPAGVLHPRAGCCCCLRAPLGARGGEVCTKPDSVMVGVYVLNAWQTLID